MSDGLDAKGQGYKCVPSGKHLLVKCKRKLVNFSVDVGNVDNRTSNGYLELGRPKKSGKGLVGSRKGEVHEY